MSDEKEDLELEALQRRLDDAFATTRPRRDFEDELWLKMQARRPATSRLRDAIASLVGSFRDAPAVPLGAVAVLLIVVIGVGVLASSGVHLGHNSTAGTALSQAAPVDRAAGAFGRLPTPALHPGVAAPAATAAVALPSYLAPSNLYFGPATLRWTGQMPSQEQAPVFRYVEPGAPVAQRLATAMGASAISKAGGAGSLGTYAGQGFSVTFQGTISQLPREPSFALTVSDGPRYSDGDIESVINGFLARYGLTPAWPYVSSLNQAGDSVRVDYLRSDVGGGLFVDWTGERYGIEVDLVGGQVRSAAGPLPLDLDSAYYHLITNDQAIAVAVAAAPASSQAIQPLPVIDLNRVDLVYALAVSKGQGFYEPAYLFSGQFQYNGQTYTKRVLVPLVDPSQLSS